MHKAKKLSKEKMLSAAACQQSGDDLGDRDYKVFCRSCLCWGQKLKMVLLRPIFVTLTAKPAAFCCVGRRHLKDKSNSMLSKTNKSPHAKPHR